MLELDTDIHGVLRWELREDDGATDLTFTVTTSAPDDQLLLAVSGWHIHLEHLADALGGRPVDWPCWAEEHRPRWDEIHARYVAGTA